MGLTAEDSERAVLAAAIRDPDRLAFLEVETGPQDFTGLFRPRLRDTVVKLAKQSVPVTFDLVESAYVGEHQDKAVAFELDAIRSELGASEAWQYHLEQARSAGVRRRLVKESEELIAMATGGDPDQDLLSRARGLAIAAVGLEPNSSQVISGSDCTAEVKSDYFAGRKNYVDLAMGPQAYPFRGIRPGEVFTLLAKTWVGKSLWASQAIINTKVPTLVISLEMPRAQWWERTIGQLFDQPLRQSLSSLSTGQLKPQQYAALAALERRVALCDRCEGTLPALEAAIKRCEMTLKVRPMLVVIDYLQLLNISGNRAASTYQKSSEAAIEVKRLAKRADVAIMLLSQVSRKDNVDGSSEVNMESARDSGQIEESADFLLGLWRPCLKKGINKEEYELKEPQMRGRLLKNRRGRAFEWNFLLNTASLRISPE